MKRKAAIALHYMIKREIYRYRFQAWYWFWTNRRVNGVTHDACRLRQIAR
jgi:hypothetical protein